VSKREAHRRQLGAIRVGSVSVREVGTVRRTQQEWNGFTSGVCQTSQYSLCVQHPFRGNRRRIRFPTPSYASRSGIASYMYPVSDFSGISGLQEAPLILIGDANSCFGYLSLAEGVRQSNLILTNDGRHLTDWTGRCQHQPEGRHGNWSVNGQTRFQGGKRCQSYWTTLYMSETVGHVPFFLRWG